MGLVLVDILITVLTASVIVLSIVVIDLNN